MEPATRFYICPVCFTVCDSEQECHAHRMIACEPGQPGSPRRKPVEDRFGALVSRAPRWFLEARGALPQKLLK